MTSPGTFLSVRNAEVEESRSQLDQQPETERMPRQEYPEKRLHICAIVGYDWPNRPSSFGPIPAYDAIENADDSLCLRIAIGVGC